MTPAQDRANLILVIANGEVGGFCERMLGDCAARTVAGRQSPSLASRLGPDGRPSTIAKGEGK
jgi:hypothetical protein